QSTLPSRPSSAKLCIVVPIESLSGIQAEIYTSRHPSPLKLPKSLSTPEMDYARWISQCNRASLDPPPQPGLFSCLCHAGLGLAVLGMAMGRMFPVRSHPLPTTCWANPSEPEADAAR